MAGELGSHGIEQWRKGAAFSENHGASYNTLLRTGSDGAWICFMRSAQAGSHGNHIVKIGLHVVSKHFNTYVILYGKRQGFCDANKEVERFDDRLIYFFCTKTPQASRPDAEEDAFKWSKSNEGSARIVDFVATYDLVLDTVSTIRRLLHFRTFRSRNSDI